jgi:hypothetical protein
VVVRPNLDWTVAIIGDAQLDASPPLVNRDALLFGDNCTRGFAAGVLGRIERGEQSFSRDWEEGAIESSFNVPINRAYGLMNSD